MDIQEKGLKIACAIHAALEAGLKILEVYQESFKIEIKDDGTPITLADKRANETICSSLKKLDIPLISEETLIQDWDTRKHWPYYWLIDPLDGTKEFINRNGEFTVNIALMEGHKPIGGIIYAPVSDLLYFSLDEKGAFKITGASQITGKSSPKEFQDFISLAEKLPLEAETSKIKVLHSRSHFSQATQNYVEQLQQNVSNIELTSRGSSLKFCMLAEGNADIYPRFGKTMEWDTAAGHAILKASGGIVDQLNTNLPLSYNKKELSNPDFIAFSKRFLMKYPGFQMPSISPELK